MVRKLALIVGIILMVAYAQAQDPTSGYIWESKLGKLRMSELNPNAVVLDTYEAVTLSKDSVKDWRQTKDLKKILTEKALDINERLYKMEDVAGTYISYRAIMIQKFPLTDMKKFIEEIKPALK